MEAEEEVWENEVTELQETLWNEGEEGAEEKEEDPVEER